MQSCMGSRTVPRYSEHALPGNCKIHSPLSAQIQHFDQQQQEEARRARFLNKVINDKASTLAGGLSGK